MDAESVSPIDLSSLTGLPPAQLRELLPGFLAAFIADPAASRANRARVGQVVGAWSDQTCLEVLELLGTIGADHRLYTAHPACRELSRVWSTDVVLDPTVQGAEHLEGALERGPTLIACNHLSYFDTTATDAALAYRGHAALADRLVAAAGPKVYLDPFRRVAASGLNTLPVPQSTSFAHTEKLSPRELARKAHESVEATRDLVQRGFCLVLYPEGSRSRTGHLGPFLRGVHRYFGCVEPLSIVPTAIVGTDRIMPVSDPRLHPGTVGLSFAPPVVVGEAGTAREVLEIVREAIVSMLPADHQPLPGPSLTA
ncbi:MAG: 1-acyl-sn-glycerol-3-phosphate acyltransferase [Alphaproteobacteria bacterium]|nr:1-acyl-sn-glycerol-3-phosphate acyltransferase [Alphaproteobacteria bacterium]